MLSLFIHSFRSCLLCANVTLSSLFNWLCFSSFSSVIQNFCCWTAEILLGFSSEHWKQLKKFSKAICHQGDDNKPKTDYIFHHWLDDPTIIIRVIECNSVFQCYFNANWIFQSHLFNLFLFIYGFFSSSTLNWSFDLLFMPSLFSWHHPVQFCCDFI